MPLSKPLSEYIARYLRFSKELREKAEKPEYLRMRREILDVATQWALLADATAKEAQAKDAPAMQQHSCTASASPKGGT